MRNPFRRKPIVVTDEMVEKGARLNWWIRHSDKIVFLRWEQLTEERREDERDTMRKVLTRALSSQRITM